jgi:hypothetical protein
MHSQMPKATGCFANKLVTANGTTYEVKLQNNWSTFISTPTRFDALLTLMLVVKYNHQVLVVWMSALWNYKSSTFGNTPS